MNLSEYQSMEVEIRALRQEVARLQKLMEPIRPGDGGTCHTIHEGSTCPHRPDFEVFAPSVSRKPYILCKMCKMMTVTTFKALGIFYKEYDHNYAGKQHNLKFEEKR